MTRTLLSENDCVPIIPNTYQCHLTVKRNVCRRYMYIMKSYKKITMVDVENSMVGSLNPDAEATVLTHESA